MAIQNSVGLVQTGILVGDGAGDFLGRTITGTASRISLSNGDGTGGNPTIDIDAAYVGQASITTLGTISSGTWNGTTIAVANGGTGVVTFTSDGVLYGNAAGAIQVTAQGAANTVLIANAGSPSFSSAPTVTTLAATTSVTTATVTNGAGNDLTVKMGDAAGSNKVSFTDSADAEQALLDSDGLFYAKKVGVGTSAVPHGGVGLAKVAIEGANASSTDAPNIQFTTASDDYPLLQIQCYSHDSTNLLFDAYFDGTNTKSSDVGSNFRIGKSGDTFSIRVDESIAAGNNVTFDTAFSVDKYGHITMPLQSCFEASNSVNDPSVTGDGSGYSIICNDEIEDRNGDYNNTTKIYTSPINSTMIFGGQVGYYGINGSAKTSIELFLVTSNRTVTPFYADADNLDYSGYFTMNYSIQTEIDAADTAYLKAKVSGGSKDVGISDATRFTGSIIC